MTSKKTRWWLPGLLCLVLGPALAAEVPVHECDRLAAHPLDSNKTGPGVVLDEVDPSSAIPACRAALESFPDRPRFQYQYGRALHKAGQHAEAVNWYRMAADRGHAAAQRALGTVYALGEDVPRRDDAEAAKWFRKAAEQGDVLAQARLGLLYLRGEGVPRDYGEAARWYRMAAEQGHGVAQQHLGNMYMEGRGVPMDIVEGRKWIEKAADTIQFAVYPATEKFSGTPAEIDQSSDRLWQDVRPIDKDIVKENVANGPNFAGTYRLQEIDCGAACVDILAVDLRDGRIFWAGLFTGAGALFRMDSKLIIIEENDIYRIPRRYLVLENGKIKFLINSE